MSVLTFLFTLALSNASASSLCEGDVKLSGFSEKSISERARLSAYREYTNLYDLEHQKFPRKFTAHQKGTSFAIRFKNEHQQPVVLVFHETGHLVSVFENGKKLFCEGEE